MILLYQVVLLKQPQEGIGVCLQIINYLRWQSF